MNKPLIASKDNIHTLAELKAAVDLMVDCARFQKVSPDQVFLDCRTYLRLVANTLTDDSQTLDLQIHQE